MTPAAQSLLSRILALLPSPHLKVALPGLTKDSFKALLLLLLKVALSGLTPRPWQGQTPTQQDQVPLRPLPLP